MTELIAAALFLLRSHFGISSTPLRPWLVARLGERTYLGLYSLIALGRDRLGGPRLTRARPTSSSGRSPPATALVPLIVLPFAFVLAVAGLSTPNPTAVGAPADAVRAPRRCAASSGSRATLPVVGRALGGRAI